MINRFSIFLPPSGIKSNNINIIMGLIDLCYYIIQDGILVSDDFN